MTTGFTEDAEADEPWLSEEDLQRVAQRVQAALFAEPIKDAEVYAVMTSLLVDLIRRTDESVAERLRMGMTLIEALADQLREAMSEG